MVPTKSRRFATLPFTGLPSSLALQVLLQIFAHSRREHKGLHVLTGVDFVKYSLSLLERWVVGRCVGVPSGDQH